MAERYLFFNSAANDPRIYQAQDFADYFGSVLLTGLLHTDEIPAISVSVEQGTMNTVVSTGKAIMQGHLYENTTPLRMTHSIAEPGVDRIDRIVLRLDKRNQSRFIRLFVKQGTPSSDPAPPSLQRDNNIYEISLAQVIIRGGQSFISPADIIDERGDEDICPWARSTVLPHIDTQDVIDLRNDFEEHKEKIATSTQLGHVKVGQNLTIDSDGTLHAQASSGKKVARFVIGTSTAGWTENDVDYLCDGVDDQEEINAAIQALSASGGEIIILDGTYNITAEISINKNNVSIKGNGNATILKRMWVSGSDEGVITLNGVSNCKIENLQIEGRKSWSYDHGIYLSSSDNNIIIGNICNNNEHGIFLEASSNNTIIGNICNNNGEGIRLYTSSSINNTIIGNTCVDNYDGIRIYISNRNTVTGNTCNNNSHGIRLDIGSYNTVTGNTCNDNSVIGIYLDASNNSTITGNTCSNNNRGIYSYGSSNNTITGNACIDNSSGIYLEISNRNAIVGNTCIRGTGQSSDYSSSQYTIRLVNSGNNYNLISSNNCKGKNVAIDGGTSNTNVNNKYN